MGERIVFDASHDHWTCDAWRWNGIWTSKNYALTRGIEHRGDNDHVPADSRWVSWIDRLRWGCGAINPCYVLESDPEYKGAQLALTTCWRCGMYRGPGGYRRD